MEQYILQTGTSSLEELCRHYRVSMSTIRRDIAELIRRNRVEKVYGGVTRGSLGSYAEANSVGSSDVESASSRKGQLAASFVHEGMSVFLDSGAAGLSLLPQLAKKRNITVISHSLTVLSEAARYPSLNVIALGGIYNNESASFSGKSALDELAKMSIDLVFLTADGVTLERGLTSSSYTEIEVKKNVAKWNRDLVLLAGGAEFGKNALITFCEIGRLRAIVSDQAIPHEFTRANALRRITVLSPDSQADEAAHRQERGGDFRFGFGEEEAQIGAPTAAV
jgi:DeoR family myo-inositol catabolism operon transcriptional repressor